MENTAGMVGGCPQAPAPGYMGGSRTGEWQSWADLHTPPAHEGKEDYPQLTRNW
jgi:hypothetical protein